MQGKETAETCHEYKKRRPAENLTGGGQKMFGVRRPGAARQKVMP
jgi:hypothetical protein